MSEEDDPKSKAADDLSRQSLEQIERRFETTRERIEGIEERALRRLRRPLS
jgi:DNA-directed RNA polymerase sigma subunit (sigma70/sigma32)